MLTNPRVGSAVQIWYREALRGFMPLHGVTGIVIVPGRGRPRNHLVRIDEALIIVPCGNLRPPATEGPKNS